MKIAILINTFHKGKGMDGVAEQQAIELTEGGHKVTLFTFEYDHELDGIEVVKLGWPIYGIFNFMYRLAFPLDIYKNLVYSKKLKDYDVMISHFFPMTFLAYFSKKRYPDIKYIFYNHGVGDSRGEPISIKVYVKIIEWLMSKTISNADGVISISQFIQDTSKLKKNIKKRVIYNKIDPRKVDYNLLDVNDEIQDYCKRHGPKFLYVGVLTHYKGIELLIRSFKNVVSKYQDAKLLLVGKASYGFNVNDFIGKEYQKNIIYFGAVSDADLGFLFDSCDVYVTASTWEGFGLPVVEAQLLGKPVVAFEVGAHKEVVKNGEAGILVEPFDTKKFAETMIEVYKNKEIMGEKAKKWAFKFSIRNKDNFSIVDFIRKLEEESL